LEKKGKDQKSNETNVYEQQTKYKMLVKSTIIVLKKMHLLIDDA
jgi:hypothetical protein